MLVAGNEEGAFTLSGSGELRLEHSLDREAKEQYLLLVTAADAGEATRTALPLRSSRKHHILDRKYVFSWQSETLVNGYWVFMLNGDLSGRAGLT